MKHSEADYYKTFPRKILKGLNKWRDIVFSFMGKFNVVNRTTLNSSIDLSHSQTKLQLFFYKNLQGDSKL
jgi:hypothetical protein